MTVSIASFRGIIFDFFGVLCSEVAPFWLARYFAPDNAIRIKRGVIALADLGSISEDELFAELGMQCGLSASIVRQQWWEHVAINTAVLSILDEVAPRHRIALLTNSPSRFVRDILARHGLEGRFQVIVVSSEERVAKPDPTIYALTLSRLGVPAELALMIDDNPSNVDGAIAVGMLGCVFSSGAQLRATLMKLGVFDPQE